jgi:tripartite-type tricarboxylate transporter receptor subunit TctC
MQRRRLLALAAAAPLAGLARFARAQAYPSKPIRMIVPFAAGGPTDNMTRAVASVLGPQLNQQVIVENRPGAGGNIAAAYVAQQPADGYTLLVAGQAILAINKALYAKLSYDPETDFAFIGMEGSLPNVLVTSPEAIPAKTVAEFIALARAKPGAISYGSNGVGSLSHLTTEVLANAADVKFLHVPYQGANPQMADLLAGRIGFSFIASSTTVPLVKSGKLHALAVTTPQRVPQLPDTPTLVESGYPMLDAPTWFAAMAHAKSPAPILAQLRAAFAAAIATPAYAAEMEKQSAVVVKMTAEQGDALLARERRVWPDAVKRTGATAS